ncbi:Bromodomain-containing protein [Trichophaea hybrida]|nr:Bromodomain-containing protein [Trichophaea hybrida]
MASDEAMGMDLDTSGTKQNESTSVIPEFAPSSQENIDKNGSRSPFVNGNKGITAPPSPPIPTPPLHHSSDSGHDLSDLHITSPDGSAQPQSFDKISDDLPMEGNQENGSKQPAADAKPDSTAEVSNSNTTSHDNDQPMHDVPQKKISRDRDDDEGEDRPPKRAKTADAAEPTSTNSSTSTSTDFSGPMTPARAKFVLGVVRSLRRTKDARPFSMPVDEVRLNVPTYYQIITKPMDLQTMERKLNSNEYSDLQSFVGDFKQILENCVTFNGLDHAVTAMSKTMETAFYRHMKELPGEDVVEVEKPKASKKKGSHTLSGAAAASHNKVAANKTTTTKQNAPKKEPKTSAQSPTATSPVFSLQPSGMPQIRRDSTVGDGRPKREIHPPAPKDLPYSTKPRRKQNAAELKFCDTVLKELNKKVHEPYAFPFYHPVDPVALNIPDYFKIIKRPMDLATIQDKLKMNSYENANEFEADIRLMFNNCYKFNPEGQAVHQMGRQLEAVFDQKWKEKPLYNQGSRSPQSTSPAPYHDDMSEEEEETDSQANIIELEKQLEKMKEEISAMKKGQKKKTPPVQNKSKVKGGNARKGSSSNAVPARKPKKSKDVPYISLEQKTELSERINLLPPAKMHYALIMIREMMPELGNDGAEIELDIDELDPHTLFKLYKYVSKNAPELPTKYIPPPPPPPEVLQETKSKPKAGPKSRKNKPMSAAEQEAKIKDIESRLHSFENPNAYTPAAPAPPQNAEAESSGDDESSGSESEEE